MKLAAEHLATERMLAESGLPHTILRNSWYVEVFDVQQAISQGLIGTYGDGRISGAPRADYAEAAASVLAGTGHEGKVYELGGAPFTMNELAAEISRQSGKPVAYTDMSAEAYIELLISGLSVPGKDDTDLVTAVESIPGAIIGIAAVYFLGIRQERLEAEARGGLAPRR